MNCPKCHASIVNSDSCTECGWHAKVVPLSVAQADKPRFSLPCAFAPECRDPAKYRVHHQGRLLNVCDRHDVYLVTHRVMGPWETKAG